MKNSVKMSQIALLLLVIIPGGKYLSLPAALSQQVGRDSWIVISILLVIDAICLAMLLSSVVHNKHKLSFDAIMTNSLGTVVSKLIYFVFFVLLQMRIITLMSSVYKLFSATFTINTTWIGFWLPVCAFGVYMISIGFRGIARLNQILSVIVILSLASILIYPAMETDVRNLLPLMQSDVIDIAKCSFNSTFWFADYIFIYFVLDNITLGKRPRTIALCGFGVGAGLTIFMNVLFVALYGPLAEYTDLAMSKVSQFALALTTNGRLDWLSLSLWTMSIFIKLALFMYCAYQSLKFIVGDKGIKINYFIAGAVMIFSLVPLFVPADDLLSAVLPYTVYPFIVVQYILPLFMPLLVNRANKKHQSAIDIQLAKCEVTNNVQS